MGKRQDRRSDGNLRTVLAQEAARLICDHGFADYRAAKRKAADNLGLRYFGALPTNHEIEMAVAERNRIFGAEKHQDFLIQLRSIAITVMRDLQLFKPRLVGPVLSGNITDHSIISLHLFSDPAESVGLQLVANGIRHSHISQRVKLQRDTVEHFPCYRFCADDVNVEATVFPERRNRHAPLSPLNGKPMQRAKLQEVESLANHV